MENVGILDLYKVYSLEKMTELSKRSLAMQYEQCGQIMALRQQVANADSTNRRILENQIKELERQERVRYYKNLAFNLNGAVDFICGISDNCFKYYVCLRFFFVIEMLAKECIEGLEEISDKAFANEVVGKCALLFKECQSINDEFLSSEWYKFEEANKLWLNDNSLRQVRDYKIQISKIDRELEALQNELKSTFSFMMRSSKKTSIQQEIASKNEMKSEFNSRIEALQNEHKQKEENVIVSKERVNGLIEDWESVIEKISNYFPKEKPKESTLAGQKIDTLFENAARYTICGNIIDRSMIQRKFELGYRRAGLIIDQMVEAGIIGTSIDGIKHEVLVRDDVYLEEILNELK